VDRENLSAIPKLSFLHIRSEIAVLLLPVKKVSRNIFIVYSVIDPNYDVIKHVKNCAVQVKPTLTGASFGLVMTTFLWLLHPPY